MLGYKCYFSLINVLKSNNISRAAKCKLNKAVTCGAETCVVNKSAKKTTVMTLERKMLRKIFGPVLEDNQWRIKKNAELEKLFKDANFGTFTLMP